MFIPLVLIVLAALAAAIVAYGTSPTWAQYSHGFEFILFTRRYQWALVAVGLILCVGLFGMIISGRRRAWWLIGLAPVLALFFHKFGADRGSVVLENPAFVEASAAHLADDDFVVSITLGDTAYAYPYASLFYAPVVLQTDHEKRVILLWSAYANRAAAFQISGNVRARDLEVVGNPANALVVYDSRDGQFINGVTARTPTGEKPAALGTPIVLQKPTWSQWRGEHPTGKVLSPTASRSDGPSRPILPVMPSRGIPPAAADAPRQRVTLVGTLQPAAVPSDSIGVAPINLTADGEPALLFRIHPGAPAYAFERRFGDDFRPRFLPWRVPRSPEVFFKDADTGSLWTAAGAVVGGNPPFRGKRLTPVVVDDDVDWAVARYWLPALEPFQMKPTSTEAANTMVETSAGPGAGPATRPSRRRARPSGR